MRIALLQLLPGDGPDENLRIGLDACKRAKALGADLALFPEMWSCGYRFPSEPDTLRAAAIPADGAFTAAFSALARQLELAIGLTILERFDPAPRNSLLLFDRNGNLALRYAKVHLCDFDAERLLRPGDRFPVAALETTAGTVQTGAMICFDREFPESARILMLGGAELIVAPNACPMEINRLEQLRSRAFENMLCVATCNYPEGQPDCNGRSSVFDGVAWLPNAAQSRDMRILLAKPGAGIYLADVDLEQLRAYRRREVFGNAYRRPARYGALTKREKLEPFIRDDARRETDPCPTQNT